MCMENGAAVCVFVCEAESTGEDKHLEIAKRVIKRLKTLKHPYILTYIDSFEKALAFLNNEGGLTHHTVNSISVFVTQAGDWKLSGVECCSSVATPPTPGSRPVPALQVYSPPEASTNSTPSNKWSSDMWGLGCLVWETFNTTTLTDVMDLRDTTKIPRGILDTYQQLVSTSSRCRPNPKDVLATLTKKGSFFNNDLILTLTFLEELHIKDDRESSRFLSGLVKKLDSFPDYIVKYRILPTLITQHTVYNAGCRILSALFKSILHLAAKLNYNNLNVEVLNHFARLQSLDD
ncbi:hypothetical protein Pcinc_029279 [Petrolisthes cinctipes]|uniref:N-terminal kinase-like protein n=1 Tax=Petrolisthes cinctipes TaxID=88211 RepID=A0AAE1F1B8_PETCI|nr:hypothetical protein Pcinc_029279 [Petrolisthes cinctipes]